MKNRIKQMLLFAIFLIICSCNEIPKKSSDTEKQTVKSEKKAKRKLEDKLLEKLENTKPLSLDKLTSWLPKTLGGLPLERTKSVAFYKDHAQMTGWYQKEGGSTIVLSISDVAGPNGRSLANKMFVYGTEPDSDLDGFQFRSVNVKGRLARQHFSTKKNTTNITFFHNKRILINIVASDYGVEGTWNLVDELDFESLDTLIK